MLEEVPSDEYVRFACRSGLLVAGSAVSATANENTATAIAGDGKPVVVDKGVINGRVIGGSAAEGNSAVINGNTSLTLHRRDAEW